MDRFEITFLSDPGHFRDGALPARSDHRFYAPFETAAVEDRLSGAYLTHDRVDDDSFFRRSLNGIWKCLYARRYEDLPGGIESLEHDCHGWEDIRVPAHIQLEGHDIPHYTNITYPWDGHEQLAHGEVPSRFNPVCAYVRYFRVPDEMTGRPVFISFEGVENAFALFLNGVYIGFCEDSFMTHEFDLTELLIPGENKLTVLVFKWSASSWLEDQDFFRFSGIFRSVSLFTVPDIHISDIGVSTEQLLGKYRLNLSVTSTSKCTAQFTLALPDCDPILDVQRPLEAGSNSLSFDVTDPLLWSAEAPHLYGLRITLLDAGSVPVELVPLRVGFRTFELSDGLMKLNGKRIVFKGVNRHEFSSLTGRVVSFSDTRKDLLTMKRNNINAIRTCHYPDSSFLYELADELGLYVIDETNLETHGTWAYYGRNPENYDEVIPGDNPVWTEAVLDRAHSLYMRDRNHPCVLIWSCGNESFGGSNIYKMSCLFRSLDPTRLVHYEGIFNDRRYPDTSDMESQMYTHAAVIESFLKQHREKPFICCEYSHAMGNSCGGMSEYTDLAEREPLYQGGFIWDYIDQSITTRDRRGIEFEAYGGDFGDRPTDYNFSGDGIVCGGPDRLPSPKMSEVRFNYRPVSVDFCGADSFTVTNRNLFTSTGAYCFIISLEQNGVQAVSVRFAADVAPLSSRTFRLPDAITSYFSVSEESTSASGENLPVFFTDRCITGLHKDEPLLFTVTVSVRLADDTPYAERGHEVSFGQTSFPVTPMNTLPAPEPVPYRVVRGRHNLGLIGEDFEIMFSGSGLCSYKKAGREMLKRLPSPCFWRAPVDNDRGWGEPAKLAQWKIADLYPYVTRHEIDIDCGRARITYHMTAPTCPEVSFSISYLVGHDGTVDITMKLDPCDELPAMPVFGMTFCTDAEYSSLEWFGKGPDETYCDRCNGNKLGIYHSRSELELSRYLRPQECGNHVGVRYARVTDRKGCGIEFTGEGIEFQALPYTAHELESATHPNELPPVTNTFIRIASVQMGIGGDDTWGSSCLERYKPDITGGMELHFSMRCIAR